MVNIQDLRNYKPCQKKQYEIHVCMPPKGTIVFNKLEQADSIKLMGGKTFFTVEELERLKVQNPQKFATIQQLVGSGRGYLVSDGTPFVLAGTIGEMWCVKPDKLASGYTFLSNGQPVRIDDRTLQQRCKGDCMDWQVIRSVPSNSKAWACFVPLAQKGQVMTSCGVVLNYNGVGASHGKGDFIIASDAGGQPDITNVYVVNGPVFATTYKNQGWTGCFDHRSLNTKANNITIQSLPKLFSSNSNIKLVHMGKDLEMTIRALSYLEVATSGKGDYDVWKQRMESIANNSHFKIPANCFDGGRLRFSPATEFTVLKLAHDNGSDFLDYLVSWYRRIDLDCYDEYLGDDKILEALSVLRSYVNKQSLNKGASMKYHNDLASMYAKLDRILISATSNGRVRTDVDFNRNQRVSTSRVADTNSSYN